VPYRVIIQPTAQKQLRKLPKNHRARIDRAFEFLREDPLAGKKLKGERRGEYALRVWPYRIIYTVHKKKVTVFGLAIGHRQGIYR